MTRYILTWAGILAIGGNVLACNPAFVVKRQVAYSTYGYGYKQALVATYAPLVVQVPTYSASYQPAQQLQAGELSEIVAELRLLRQAFEAAAYGPAEPSTASKVDGLAVVQTRCASCHAADVADEKGGGFVLLENDKLVQLSLAEKSRIQRRVGKDQMPPSPGKPLSESEKKALFETLKGE